MITVTYNRKDHRLTMSGHAGSAEPGHDLVCAAASILAYTLAVVVEKMAVDSQQIREQRIIFEEGNVDVRCTADNGYDAPVTLVFDSICTGFEMLSKDFQKYISYTVQG